eukprot:c25608_g1_i1 orf=314-2041(-)
MRSSDSFILFSLLFHAIFSLFFLQLHASSSHRAPLGDVNGRWHPRAQQSSEAYATLLYGDEFLLGVRVLGKSIRDTGTTKDLVVLASDGVSDTAIQLLQADGWIVEKIELLANPNHKSKRPKRFWGVYTKLKIFNMTNYKKVLYLDADTVVLRSVEDLFQCQKFCANLKHSERLNSGVMVVEPSYDVFDDMMTKVSTLPSYTGGDQGFLNSYYSDFPNAHVFDPDLSPEERNTRPKPDMERLSTLYNADVGLYMLANKWMVNENELRIVHYTLGPLKPWDWWTAWLLKPVDLWQNVRVTLEDSLPGTGGGQDPFNRLFVKVLFILPFLSLLFFGRQFLFRIQQDVCGHFWNGSFCGYGRRLLYKYRTGNSLPIYSSITASPPNGLNQQQYTNAVSRIPYNLRLPPYIGSLSVLACFCATGVAVSTGFILIPRQVMPWTGMLLLYEWTFFLFAVMYRKYLDAMYSLGRRLAAAAFPDVSGSNIQYDSTKGNLKQPSRWDAETFFYGMGMACLAILAPCLPFIFGVTILFLRLGMMVGGAMVLVAFMTYASEHLAVRWFFWGCDSWIQSRDVSFGEL